MHLYAALKHHLCHLGNIQRQNIRLVCSSKHNFCRGSETSCSHNLSIFQVSLSRKICTLWSSWYSPSIHLSLLYGCANRHFLLQAPLIAYQSHKSTFYLSSAFPDKLSCPWAGSSALPALSSNTSCRLFKDIYCLCICLNYTSPCNLCRIRIALFTCTIFCPARSNICRLSTLCLSICSLKWTFLTISWNFTSTGQTLFSWYKVAKHFPNSTHWFVSSLLLQTPF